MFRHGMYEITYKASPHPVISWKDIKEQTIVVEADDSSDAERIAKTKIKEMGYDFIYIGLYAVKFLKYTNQKSKSEEIKDTSEYDKTERFEKSSYESASSSTKAHPLNLSYIIGILGIIVLVISFFAGMIISSSSSSSSSSYDTVDGRYYLVSITGNQNVTATSKGNYLDLDNGVCTLHISLSNPQGSSTHTYYYTGNKTSNIKFQDDFIYMNSSNKVIVRLNYGNGYYNIFTYEPGQKYLKS